MARIKRGEELPADVAAIREQIAQFFAHRDEQGRSIGGAKHGVYAFYDYDLEPIYVGQTKEKLSGRIGRHLTNQRTDAVAMNVLDPFEVAEIEIWPLDDAVAELTQKFSVDEILARAEYAVFEKVLGESALGAVHNEKDIQRKEAFALPRSYRRRIIPDSIYEHRKHADIRIARRASTIANLARVISERSGSQGLRRTIFYSSLVSTS